MDTNGMVNPDSPYFRRMVEWVNSFGEDLWDNLERVPYLEPHIGEALLNGFIELAYQCQNIGNILSGRQGILSLPRHWVIEHIEELAEPILQTDDDWEWRRLIEVYDGLDKNLAKKFALRAISHPNSEIKEVGEDYIETYLTK